LKNINLGDTETIGGVAAALQNSDAEAIDPHLERKKKKKHQHDGGNGGEDSDEEDEDFVAEKDDVRSPIDDCICRGQ
jgi:structure-specific recognition protein 1